MSQEKESKFFRQLRELRTAVGTSGTGGTPKESAKRTSETNVETKKPFSWKTSVVPKPTERDLENENRSGPRSRINLERTRHFLQTEKERISSEREFNDRTPVLRHRKGT